MRALSVVPGHEGTLSLVEMEDPEPASGELVVDALAMGVCGTDKEIVNGDYGWAPDGEERLVIGHESLGRVREAPESSEFAKGDLVVGVVRRPDPVPCGACARGQFDMCRNGRYTERGIKEIHGYGSEVWCVEQEYAVKLDEALAEVGVLMEPTTVVAKAWDQIEKVGHRAWFEPRTVLVTGAGPIGLLAAMLGVQRGLEVHVLDRVTDGPKPDLVSDLGATYHHGDVASAVSAAGPDVIIEATGVGSLVFDAMQATASYGVVCLTGVSPKGRSLSVDAGSINREIVLENDVVIGSVNANLDHYRAAADSLAQADLDWLGRLVSRRVPLDSFHDAFEARDDDVKVVITLGGQPE
jgi:threonine dehydrogenase-like Zn-dependent dehydrogenase